MNNETSITTGFILNDKTSVTTDFILNDKTSVTTDFINRGIRFSLTILIFFFFWPFFPSSGPISQIKPEFSTFEPF